MIVKSPLKEKKTKPNVRKSPSNRKKNGAGKGLFTGPSNGNGGSHGRRINEKKKSRISLPSVKPWKVILGAFVIGGLGVLYLNHVFATQELLREVQQLEQQYNQAQRMHDDYRLTFDRMIGPAEIYEKAKSQGFVNSGPAEKIIEVEQE
jgi:cell division protein FtsL